MIAIGGTIGTGLFFGSGWAIKTSGPSVILTYLFVGIAIYFIMRALGEMAVEEPVSGSYVSYANRYIHRFTGFLLGWNILIYSASVSTVEFNVLGQYVQFWFPDIPIWVSALAAVVVLFIVNIIGVKLYGESEFWFSIVKVGAIVLMIILGSLMILFGTGNGGKPIGFGNLVNDGGFIPNGISGLIMSIVMVAFAFGGIEFLGLTAGEAKNVFLKLLMQYSGEY